MGSEIRLLGYIALTFIAFTLLTFCYITIRKWKDSKQKKINESVANQHSDELYHYLVNGDQSEALVPNASNYKGIELLLKKFLSVIDGEELRQRVKTYTEQYFTLYYRHNLNRGKWSVRMNTLYNIVEFQMDTLWEDITRKLNKPKECSTEEYLQMCKSIIRSHDPNFLSYIRSGTKALAPFQYREIVDILSDEQLQMVFDRFEVLPAELKYGVIDMVSIHMKVDYIPILEQLLFSETTEPDEEMRIRLLKAVANIGYTDNIAAYFRFVDSPRWEERAMTAKLFGALNTPVAWPHLRKFTKDPSWYVRNEASVALSKSREGLEILQEIAMSSKDRYAQDMAKEILGRTIS